MLYTAFGAFICGFLSYIVLKAFRFDFKGTSFFPGPGTILVFICTLIGGGIGLGYGSALLLSGRHLFNRLLG